MKEIVLIRLAAGAPSQVDVEQLRDYVIESINKGVLVLGAGAEISTMELPEPIREVPEFMLPGLLGDADIVLTGESWSSEASEPEEGNRGANLLQRKASLRLSTPAAVPRKRSASWAAFGRIGRPAAWAASLRWRRSWAAPMITSV